MTHRPFAGVAGWPAAHSLSPLMMRTWLREAGIPGEYGVFELPENQFERLVNDAGRLGLSGLNVTLPHKESALSLANTASEAAAAIGAANLLTFEDGRVVADNTDFIGIDAALRGSDQTQPALLIGAGGAARAALYYLAAQDREIRIYNRTRHKADRLNEELGAKAQIVTDLEDGLVGAGLVINSTSLGMVGQPGLSVDLSTCRDDSLVFDMVYTPLKTPLLEQAEQRRLKTADGLTMLIGQAEPSFEAFFGQAPAGADFVRSVLESKLEQER